MKESKKSPEKLNSNEIHIDGYGVLKIKPTKLKYFIPNSNKEIAWYEGINFVVKDGYHVLLTQYSDGKDTLIKALKAVFDIEEVDFFDLLTSKNIIEIAKLANEINEINVKDFLTMPLPAEREKQ